MDSVNSIKVDKIYIKHKSLVRKWEKEFTTRNSRLPSKYDIKEAPEKVRYAYKQYFNMKSAALQESILDCTLDEESVSGSPEFPPLADSMFDLNSPNSEFPSADLPSTSELEILLTSAKKSSTLSSSNNVKTDQIATNKSNSNTNISGNISKKLFEKSKFSLRNPRKSSCFQLNKTLSESKIECNANISDANTDFQMGDALHSLKFSNAEVTNYETNECKQTQIACKENVELPSLNTTANCMSVMNIDIGWLERSAGVKLSTSNIEPGGKSQIKYGLRNVVSSVTEKKSQSDYVENSESETDDICSKTLIPALKKRKLDNHDNNLTEPSKQVKNKYDKEKSSIIAKKVNKNRSVEETSERTRSRTATSKRDRNLKQHKEDSPEPPSLDDYVSIDAGKDLIPRFDKESTLYAINKSIPDITQPGTSKTTSGPGKLEQKIKNGTLNENFVKINMKKKVFVRGKKSFNYSKFKKKEWKDKNSLNYEVEFPEGGKSVCFKCGKAGHMSRYCTAHRGDSLLPLDASSVDETPTLSEMENKVINECNNEIQNLTKCATSVIPDSFLELLSQSSECSPPIFGDIKPIYSPDQQDIIPNEVQESLEMFGHKNFRSGQKEAIMRILSGLSTLLVLSTGSGKSLCYQLPAYIFSKYYKCVTLVISPLVSLMDDQVLSMPEFLRAGCLHTNQTPTQRKKILELLKNGELNILLISPEALISGERNSGMGNLFKNMPPIAFACIDEVHCVSQWSHNFRPSYLMICRVLREKLKVNCILGLTATASQPTIESIIDHLNICDGSSGVINNPHLPQNLMLSVSFEKDKDRSLISLLSSEPFSNYNSIIIYCIRRDECERVASMVRSTFQEPGKITTERGKKRKRMSYIAETYHAGMTAAQRRKIQENFMNGSLKIIVATVAFGMGINKSDIRCIIHYNMPKSFESYVQEIGRAGRDGKAAHCHVFLNNNNDDDKNELLKHIYSNNIDRHIIRKLLQKVFVPCDCKKNFLKVGLEKNRCKGHEVAFSIDDTVEELDIASENISTLLCYLELRPKKYIQILNNCYTMCKIYSYGGPEKLVQAAKTCPPLAMAYTLCGKGNNAVETTTTLDFPVIDVAAAMGWESGVVKYHLKNLEWITNNGVPKRSTIKVEFHTLGFRVRASGDLTPSEMDEMLDELHKRVSTQEETMLYQLQEISQAFKKVGKTCLDKLFNSDSTTLEEQSNELKEIIKEYFLRTNVIDKKVHIDIRPLNEERAISDIKALISAYKDCTFSGKSVARIFQGISSPNFPALVWGRCKFWRSHIHEDFHGLAKLATQQLISMRY